MSHRNDEAGFSVVELLVVVVLLGAMSVILTSFLMGMTNVTARSTDHVTAEREGMLALRRMSQDIRAASPIMTAAPTGSACASGVTYPDDVDSCVSFVIVRSNFDIDECTAPDGQTVAGPYTLVTFGLVGETIRMDRTDYAYDAGTDACIATPVIAGGTVIEDVTNASSGKPLFEFFGEDGDELDVDASEDLSGAASVRINVDRRYRTGAETLSLFSYASLRNER